MDEYTNPQSNAGSPEPQHDASTAPERACEPIIESASATTAHDNHAGATPLIITACALALMLVLGYGLIASLGSLAKFALNAYESNSGAHSYSGKPYDLDDLDDLGDLDDLDDIDDLLEDLLGNSGSSMQRRGGTSINTQFGTTHVS